MEEKCGLLTFFSNFDSGNLSKVELVESSGIEPQSKERERPSPAQQCDYEYKVWTCPDCEGTPYENGNRSWFYFGVKGGQGGKTMKINIMNMNKQGKLYSQGMTPVVKVVPSKDAKWERVRGRVYHQVVDGQFILTFTYTFPEIRNSTAYFAFCYPHSYKECQKKLAQLDKNHLPSDDSASLKCDPSIYYHRQLLCYSIDGLRIDLITISSNLRKQEEKEDDIPGLFPDNDEPKANKFVEKKVFFLSARVHPGETPASFVFNGFIDFILRRNDPRATALRDKFVFKLIPMLNPDGVFKGHYRTDTRGINLNRVYSDPDPYEHPAVFAVKNLVEYYHNQYQVVGLNEGIKIDARPNPTAEPMKSKLIDSATHQRDVSNQFISTNNAPAELQVEKLLLTDSAKEPEESKEELDVCVKLKEAQSSETQNDDIKDNTDTELKTLVGNIKKLEIDPYAAIEEREPTNSQLDPSSKVKSPQKWPGCVKDNDSNIDSGLAFYVDLHGHASKRGCFIYANNFENEDEQVECLLLPKLMSINSANFDFNGCNFSLRNMHAKDKRDGMSKEGSGRVAVFRATGLLQSYTLECNYNTGRIANTVPPAFNDNGRATPPPAANYPPKYTPEIYAEVGRALAISVLDIFEINPWSRILGSEFHTLANLKSYLHSYVQQTKSISNFQKSNSTGTMKNNGRPPPILSSMLKPQAPNQNNRKVKVKTERGVKPNTVSRSKTFLRNSSFSKAETSKASQPVAEIDGKSSVSFVKVIQIPPIFPADAQDETMQATKQLITRQNESFGKPRRDSKITPSSTRSQINKLTLSFDSSKITRTVNKKHAANFLVSEKYPDNIKDASKISELSTSKSETNKDKARNTETAK